MQKDDESSKTAGISEINVASIASVQGQARRAQHPKQHGCARARFIIGDVPDDLREGLFRTPGIYEALVRFSNGRRFDDRSADAHGMAIKVLGVTGTKALEGKASEAAQDFVLVDHETFFTGDLGDYEKVNRAAKGTGLSRIVASLSLLSRWSLLTRVRRFASSRLVSPLATSYFSTTPYRLGPDKYVKWLALPESAPSAGEGKLRSADGLSETLLDALERGSVRFRFGADIQTDASRQPIDDPTVAWSAMRGARREWLAILELPTTDAAKQPREFLHPGAALGENLVFSPWHTLTEHEPVGAINRARREVYAAAAEKRHKVNRLEPLASSESPDSYRMHHIAARPRNGGMAAWLFALACLIFAACLFMEFKRLTTKPGPPTTFDDPVAEFKYGSIGAEWSGFPYVVWRELPTIFADRMPDGWETFGFIHEPGSEVPIGISVRRLGVQRVGFNCATCHSAEVIVGNRTFTLLGAPAAQLDIQAYILFLADAAAGNRLTAESVIESAAENGRPFGLLGRLLVRRLLVPQVREQSQGLASTFAWMDQKPRHGPGRTDAGNSWRSRWGLHPENDDAVGTVDFPSVWNQRIRHGGWFHWDGNNSSLSERNYSAALAGGAKEWLLQRDLIDAQSAWLDNLPPPQFPQSRDQPLFALGAAVYEREGCGTCHDPGGEHYGQVTPLSELGTDPARADLFNEDFVARFETVGKGYSWQFSHYRPTDGYANQPLDGIWARAPYLHNGSVPTLAALFSPPDDRPATFLRGCRTFDPITVGYACSDGFQFDTALRGNGNAGHEYGTDLPDDEKAALIEYLKFIEHTDHP